LRIGWRLAALVLHAMLGVFIQWCAYPFLGEAMRDRYARRWSRICLGLCAVHLEVVDGAGRPADLAGLSGVLLLANHVSWLDIVVMNANRPSHFVAKTEIRRWPVIGMLARRNGTIFIERGRRHAVHDVIRLMVDELRAGKVCSVFPEGTTSDGTAVLPFHANLIESAIEAPAPIVPLTLRYLDHGRPSTRAAYVGEDSLFDSVVKVLSGPGLSVRVIVGEALLPPHAGTRHVLAGQVRDQMVGVIDASR
jgi:1-acyl-sn-glycerol-3-phosphate acyltransferase